MVFNSYYYVMRLLILDKGVSRTLYYCIFFYQTSKILKNYSEEIYFHISVFLFLVKDYFFRTFSVIICILRQDPYKEVNYLRNMGQVYFIKENLEVIMKELFDSRITIMKPKTCINKKVNNWYTIFFLFATIYSFSMVHIFTKRTS